jgi:hypothetical protein
MDCRYCGRSRRSPAGSASNILFRRRSSDGGTGFGTDKQLKHGRHFTKRKIRIR